MRIKPLHLSHSASSSDGGIATAVSQLLTAQQRDSMLARWITADQYQPLNRDHHLIDAIRALDIQLIHSHGLWRSATRVLKSSRLSNLPMIISPHGMLDEWAMAYSPWKKWIVWQLWESYAMNEASCIHALCEAEAQAIRRFLPKARIAVIPNGVYLPASTSINSLDPPWSKQIPEGDKVLLFLGRFHQKKGLEPLLNAWLSVLSLARKHRWWLVFIGFGDGGDLENQLRDFPIERCLVYGPAFGAMKHTVLSNASAFVLPSFSEGLPMAALEAMAYQLPCLLSQACNLPQAFQSHAAIEADPDSARLIQSLQQLFLQSDHERSSMGSQGYDLVSKHFTWEHVSKKFKQLYSWNLGLISSAPDFVQVSL